MNPDDFKQAWRTQSSQTRLAIDAELLLEKVQRNHRSFTAIIFWRDVREVGTALLMIPVWLFLGVRFSLPWTWYLAVPAMLWVAGYMLVDRIRHRQQPSQPGEPLRNCVQGSLAEVEHQIWLLRNVVWWYLLPLALSLLAFFAQVTWQERSGGWLTALVISLVVVIVVTVFSGVYWLNQYAVRADLEPRRQELDALLASLGDEAS
jgi:hypothetical protein